MDDDECTSNCKYDSAPHEGRVDITVTIYSLNPEVIIEIFHGDVEDNDLMESRIVTEEKLRLTLPNGDYSVRANYKAILEGETVTVYSVDGDCLAADSYGECGDICYDEGSIDLDQDHPCSYRPKAFSDSIKKPKRSIWTSFFREWRLPP